MPCSETLPRVAGRGSLVSHLYSLSSQQAWFAHSVPRGQASSVSVPPRHLQSSHRENNYLKPMSPSVGPMCPRLAGKAWPCRRGNRAASPATGEQTDTLPTDRYLMNNSRHGEETPLSLMHGGRQAHRLSSTPAHSVVKQCLVRKPMSWTQATMLLKDRINPADILNAFSDDE